MAPSNPKTLPIIPLAHGSVLLPGVTVRVPVANRTDIPALLSSVYTRAATLKPDATVISIGCVPLNSPLLSPDGQRLLDDKTANSWQVSDNSDINPGKAGRGDLFSYGTVAKISGVQGRRPGELALIVEGVRRFKIYNITQDKPYFEAEVTYQDEGGK